MRRLKRILRRFLHDDGGQATVEYAMVFWYTILFVGGAYYGIKLLEVAIIGYYRDTALLLCLPFP
jgi:Flp pilus assembly protein TadG